MPKKWEKKVIEAAKSAGVPDVKIASMIDRLSAAKKLRVFDFGRGYDHEQTWIQSAVREHAARPFHAIIYAGGAAPCAEALAPEQCEDGLGLFAAPISREIARSVDAIADALLLTAAPATEIDIVDPYFDMRDGKFVGPLASLLAKLGALGASPKVIRVHFHTHGSRPPAAILLASAPGQTNGIIPTGYALELHEWAQIRKRPG